MIDTASYGVSLELSWMSLGNKNILIKKVLKKEFLFVVLVKLYLYSDFWSRDGMWEDLAAPQNMSEQIDNNTNSNASVEFYFCRNHLKCTGVQRPSINQVCDGIEDDKFLYLK